jgi:hypothetical protein
MITRLLHTSFIKTTARLLLLVPVLLLMSMRATTPQVDHEEYTLKALFVFNFTKHIEWPPNSNPGDHFVITVYGNSLITEKLATLFRGRKVFDKPIEIRETTKLDELAGSQILFISRDQSDKLAMVLEKYKKHGILFVTESKNLATKGSCINIIESDEKLSIELNDAAMKREGLKVSNQLYELAKVIR